MGFFARGKLKKVSIAGGWPQKVGDAPDGRGGTWNSDNVILFASMTIGGLQRISADGGTPAVVSQLDTKYGETSHRFPWFLPDGRHFLYTATAGTCCPAAVPARVKIGTLDTVTTSTLMQVESAVVYAAGHVLFNRDGVLMAQRFELSSNR